MGLKRCALLAGLCRWDAADRLGGCMQVKRSKAKGKDTGSQAGEEVGFFPSMQEMRAEHTRAGRAVVVGISTSRFPARRTDRAGIDQGEFPVSGVSTRRPTDRLTNRRAITSGKRRTRKRFARMAMQRFASKKRWIPGSPPAPERHQSRLRYPARHRRLGIV